MLRSLSLGFLLAASLVVTGCNSEADDFPKSDKPLSEMDYKQLKAYRGQVSQWQRAHANESEKYGKAETALGEIKAEMKAKAPKFEPVQVEAAK